MLVGYMRVSSDSDRQSTDLQSDALLAADLGARHNPYGRFDLEHEHPPRPAVIEMAAGDTTACSTPNTGPVASGYPNGIRTH